MKKVVLTLGFSAATMIMTAQTTRYVTQTGAGSKNGTSWVNASDDLQLLV